jgi:hypothetical protein
MRDECEISRCQDGIQVGGSRGAMLTVSKSRGGNRKTEAMVMFNSNRSGGNYDSEETAFNLLYIYLVS